MKLNEITIKEAYLNIRKKEISSAELTRSCLDRIKDIDKKIGAFITVTEKSAIKQAEEIDARIAKGEKLNYLAGIPLAIKDVILVAGVKNTCGSKILENYIAPYDASVVERLKKAGAIIIGKTNCDEFAMGSSNENSAFKECKNPWDIKRVPGGSSGGSAAAVAADECIFSLGSDTGGSIRQPAALCSVVGFKPTYGRVSRYGLSALASSLDQIGPITKSVEDASWVFSAIAGTDEKDSTCLTEAVPEFFNNIYPGIKDVKIGIPKECFAEGLDSGIKSQVEKEIKKFESLGAIISEVSLPHIKYSLPAYYIIMPAEASSNLARYDGIRYGRASKNEIKDLLDAYLKNRAEGLGDEAKRRIMLGTYTLSSGYYDAYYAKAQKVRTKIIEDYKKVFDKVDLLLTPTVPDVAFKIGEKVENPLAMYMSDILTVSANISGLPAISVPAGFVKNMPVGLQITGNYYNERKLLEAALSYEINSDWRDKKPKI